MKYYCWDEGNKEKLGEERVIPFDVAVSFPILNVFGTIYIVASESLQNFSLSSSASSEWETIVGFPVYMLAGVSWFDSFKLISMGCTYIYTHPWRYYIITT